MSEFAYLSKLPFFTTSIPYHGNSDSSSSGLSTGSSKSVSEFENKVNGYDIIKDEDGNLMLNPALYYYFDGEVYLRAFDDNGIRYDASLGKPLYYANLLRRQLSYYNLFVKFFLLRAVNAPQKITIHK